MKELVVISGKGGTGKTSVVASFAALAKREVLADCDVDAADLYIVLNPKVLHRNDFVGGKTARIKPGHCTACGKCEELCRFDAIFLDGPGNGTFPKTFRVDPLACEGCGVCAHFCAEGAIEFTPTVNGQWFISDTRHGTLVHAKLHAGGENSGKLVTIIRNEARNIAARDRLDTIIVDGSPGIGCPVIASITGADMVLAVTEPTKSGLHDLERVIELAGHFGIPLAVTINKWDLNGDMTRVISEKVQSRGIDVLGTIRYDRAVTDSMVQGSCVVEFTDSPVTQDVRALWQKVHEKLSSLPEKQDNAS
ncbi:ATP-binding protein [bacterium]|nr:ATP-binding protein [bacterium]